MLLAKPISDLCNLSINSEKFPDLCKVANLKPLHKKGSLTQPCNCRPISLLPLIPKVIEKVIYAQTSTFPNSKNLLYTYLCPNYLNEVFDVAIENNFQLRGSFQKLKCPFRKTNTGQLALSYIGPTFWNKTPDTLKRTKNLIPSNII